MWLISCFDSFWTGIAAWKALFQAFLNIPSCDMLPDVKEHRRQLEDVVRSSKLEPRDFNAIMEKLEKSLIRI